MYLYLILLILPYSLCDVEESFKSSKLVPDVIKSPPESELFVVFSYHKVSLGNKLTPKQVNRSPIVSWIGSEKSYYTLTFSDPDAPSAANHTSREFLHWLVGNIPGTDLSRATSLAEFRGSAPGKGTGDHRYCLLVFKQPGVIDFKMDAIPADNTPARRNFSAQQFAEKHGLDPVPVAGNFFISHFVESDLE